MSAGDSAPAEDLLLKHLDEVVRLTRLLRANHKGGEVMAADPSRRPQLEKMLADFDRWHGPMVKAARELGQCRDLLRKLLKPKRFGRFL